jgi:hypothetical protein
MSSCRAFPGSFVPLLSSLLQRGLTIRLVTEVNVFVLEMHGTYQIQVYTQRTFLDLNAFHFDSYLMARDHGCYRDRLER